MDKELIVVRIAWLDTSYNLILVKNVLPIVIDALQLMIVWIVDSDTLTIRELMYVLDVLCSALDAIITEFGNATIVQ